eukprot:comp20797_c0_seq2/m.42960 comp20797_c0_seq2/g.42960  ORF comp20797_c0_seq2/g.42960 comp20797_c0_seq2/m.42960 type:complete len:325 (-) comp20797_c0_seq2:28-1002(-)
MTIYRVQSQQVAPRANALPVVLQHGLFDSAYTWLVNGKGSSLAFQLADEGFDVWLVNSRGNWFTQIESWVWDWDQMAVDLEGFVGLVLANTKSVKVNIVAHSQGSAVTFARLATSRRFNSMVNTFFALAPPLAPAGAQSKAMSILAFTHADVGLSALDCVTCVLKVLNSVLGGPLGPGIFNDLFGTPYSPETYSDQQYVGFFPAPTSGKNIAHWVKTFRRDTFSDYSGQPYDLSAISGPEILVYVGSNDNLATVDDSDINLSRWPIVTIPGFAHMDFTWSPAAATMVNSKIIAHLTGSSSSSYNSNSNSSSATATVRSQKQTPA